MSGQRRQKADALSIFGYRAELSPKNPKTKAPVASFGKTRSCATTVDVRTLVVVDQSSFAGGKKNRSAKRALLEEESAGGPYLGGTLVIPLVGQQLRRRVRLHLRPSRNR